MQNEKQKLIEEIKQLQERQSLIEEINAMKSEGARPTMSDAMRPALDAAKSGFDPLTTGVLALKGLAKSKGASTAVFDAPETAARSFLEGATLGISEPVVGAIKTVAHGAPLLTLLTPGGMQSAAMGFMKKIFEGGPSIKEGIAKDAIERRALKKESPVVSGLSEIAGAVAPTPFNVAGKLFKGAQAFSEAAGLSKVVKGAGPLSKLGRGGLKAVEKAAEGGAAAFAHTGARQVILEPTGYLKDGEENSVQSGKAGLVIGGGLSLLGSSLKAGGQVGNMVLRSTFGLKEGVAKKYISRAKEINKLGEEKGFEGIRDDIENFVSDLHEQVQSKTLGIEDAEKALSEVLKKNKLAIDSSKSSLKEKTIALRGAIQAETERLKNIKPPVEMAGELNDAVAALKRRVVDGSKRALDELSDADGSIKLSPVIDQAKSLQSKLLVNGAEPAMPAQRQAFRDIGNLIKDLESLVKRTKDPVYGVSEVVDDVIPLSKAKEIVSKIDDAVEYISSTGGFSSESDIALKTMRKTINDELRRLSPKFASKMDEVSQDSELLNRANKLFGTQVSASSSINSLQGATKAEQRGVLDALGKRVGKDFSKRFDDYNAAQAALRSRSTIGNNLPEMAAVRKESAALSRLKISGKMDEFTAKQKLAEQNAAFDSLSEKLGESVFGIAKSSDPNHRVQRIESMMKQLMHAKPQERESVRRTAKRLSELSGNDFNQALDDLAVLQAFESSSINGSRRVGWGSAVGIALGSIVGGLGFGSIIGGAIGAHTGKLLDVYGPKVAKDILDAAITAKGSVPAFAKNINALPIPAEAKKGILLSFKDGSARRALVANQSKRGSLEQRRVRAVGVNEGDQESPR